MKNKIDWFKLWAWSGALIFSIVVWIAVIEIVLRA